MSKDIFLFFIPCYKFTCKATVLKTKVGCASNLLAEIGFKCPAASGTGKALSGADFNLRSSQSSLPDKN